MKAVVARFGKEWRVDIIHGNQRFRLNYDGVRDECRWMARMFNKALKRHDTERKGK